MEVNNEVINLLNVAIYCQFVRSFRQFDVFDGFFFCLANTRHQEFFSLMTTDRFQYIKIQPNTNRPQQEAPGNKPHKLCTYSPASHIEVHCFRLGFNISKLAY